LLLEKWKAVHNCCWKSGKQFISVVGKVESSS